MASWSEGNDRGGVREPQWRRWRWQARSEGEEVREEMRASARESGGASRRGGVAWRGRARMAAMRRRGPNMVGRACGATVTASGRREMACAGETGLFRWLGQLVGAGPPVNSAPFLF